MSEVVVTIVIEDPDSAFYALGAYRAELRRVYSGRRWTKRPPRRWRWRVWGVLDDVEVQHGEALGRRLARDQAVACLAGTAEG